MELDAIAHGNHDVRALVVVEEVMDGRASALVDGAGFARVGHSGCVSRCIECEVEGDLRTRKLELDRGEWLEFGWVVALGLDEELSVLKVDADRGVGAGRG